MSGISPMEGQSALEGEAGQVAGKVTRGRLRAAKHAARLAVAATDADIGDGEDEF